MPRIGATAEPANRVRHPGRGTSARMLGAITGDRFLRRCEHAPLRTPGQRRPSRRVAPRSARQGLGLVPGDVETRAIAARRATSPRQIVMAITSGAPRNLMALAAPRACLDGAKASVSGAAECVPLCVVPRMTRRVHAESLAESSHRRGRRPSAGGASAARDSSPGPLPDFSSSGQGPRLYS